MGRGPVACENPPSDLPPSLLAISLHRAVISSEFQIFSRRQVFFSGDFTPSITRV